MRRGLGSGIARSGSDHSSVVLRRCNARCLGGTLQGRSNTSAGIRSDIAEKIAHDDVALCSLFPGNRFGVRVPVKVSVMRTYHRRKQRRSL